MEVGDFPLSAEDLSKIPKEATPQLTDEGEVD